jgi:hypothetical protein
MRQGPHTKRGRGRGGNNNSSSSNRRSGTPNRNQTFDSNGPEVRIRGNANQVHEKYLNLARDASTSGDRVLAESYFQHAEHYFRIISAFTDEPAADPNRNRGNGSSQGFSNNGDGGQFGEDEPQPELNQSSAEPRSSQPGPPSPPDRPEVVSSTTEAQTIPPVAVVPEQPRNAEITQEAPSEPVAEQPAEEAPARPALSLRRRRSSSSATSKESRGEAGDASAGASSGVTVTVVGAPTVETSDAPAPPRRPRRKPRATPAAAARQEDSSSE